LVDKEPLGLRGEVRDTLALLKAARCRLVLGLRDVMDEPTQLAWEWERKNAAPALTELYDSIWVYGLPEICNALDGIDLPRETLAKIRYTGYLRREGTGMTRAGSGAPVPAAGAPPLLVTPGGGGDGALLVDWVLRAYEADPGIPHPALIVLGPFMHSDQQAAFRDRARRLDRVRTLVFDANMEDLVAASAAIVAMGGYNTFCEILSFDKPALLVPRTAPRREQYIRAARAEALGLVSMLRPDDGIDARAMADLLRALPSRPRPSEVRIPGLLDGLEVICEQLDRWLAATAAARRRVPALS
jgi:predicted glycosyltransferase